MRELGPPKYW